MALAGAGVAESGIQSNPIVGKAARKRSRSRRWAFLGLLPFAAFITIFLLIPTGELIVGAFRTANGAFTFSNIRDIFNQPYPAAFEFSLELSGLSALDRRRLRVPRGQCRPAPRHASRDQGRLCLLFGHGGELRRRAAGVRLHSDSRLARRRHPAPEARRAAHLPRVQPPEPHRRVDRLRLLPVPPHGAAHGPRDRGTAHRVEGGGLQSRRELLHLLALRRRCRSSRHLS